MVNSLSRGDEIATDSCCFFPAEEIMVAIGLCFNGNANVLLITCLAIIHES